MKIDFKKSALLAAILVIAMLAVTFVFTNYLGGAPQTFYSTVNIPGIGSVNVNLPQTYTPVSPTISGQIVQWISGVIPGIPPVGAILTLFISAFVVVLLGNFLVGMLNIKIFNGKVGQLATVLIVGAVIPYIYFVGAVVPSFGVMGFVGLMIYTFAAAFVTALVADLLKMNVV